MLLTTTELPLAFLAKTFPRNSLRFYEGFYDKVVQACGLSSLGGLSHAEAADRGMTLVCTRGWLVG